MCTCSSKGCTHEATRTREREIDIIPAKKTKEGRREQKEK